MKLKLKFLEFLIGNLNKTKINLVNQKLDVE